MYVDSTMGDVKNVNFTLYADKSLRLDFNTTIVVHNVTFTPSDVAKMLNWLNKRIGESELLNMENGLMDDIEDETENPKLSLEIKNTPIPKSY